MRVVGGHVMSLGDLMRPEFLGDIWGSVKPSDKDWKVRRIRTTLARRLA